MMPVAPDSNKVYLVGAGPGSPGLLTLRAHWLIISAEVIIYDYLCAPEILRWARQDAEIIYAGKSGSDHTLTQDEINALLVKHGQAGKLVVRLKGGDPYVFGRGGEEAQVLARAGVPFEVVPGVSSAIAAPSYAGIPVTHRGVASTVTFVTGHEDPTKPDSAIDWPQLARLRGTKVFLMGIERLREITSRLVQEGADPATPVALVRWGTTPRQETLEGTLTDIADLAEKRGFKPPAITVVGDVVKLREELNWFEKLPLFGQRVVVTRPGEQGGSLASKLALLGADVLGIPTIRIAPVALGEPERAKLKALSSHFDWLVFTSRNGANFFFGEFFRVSDDLRDLGPVKIAAVGPSTATHLKFHHLRVDLKPEVYNAENLAATFAGLDIKGRRFCLVQGRLTKPLLADQLRAAGAQVETWTIYDTQPETGDLYGARARYLKEGAHWIAFTSASTVENWHALKLEPAPGAARPRAASIGPVTSAALKTLGYDVAVEAPKAQIKSLVDAIVRSV